MFKIENKNKKDWILWSTVSLIFLAAVFFGFAKSKKVEIKKIREEVLRDFPVEEKAPPKNPAGFEILWATDFHNNRVLGFAPDGKLVWEQNMSVDPIPKESWYFIGGVEYVTLAPNGNLIATHGDGMMVQELDRVTHKLVWQFGKAGIQTYRGGLLDEPDKAYKINDHEVVINNGNDRMVIVVDQKTNQIVWQYGEYKKMGSSKGLLRGNTSVRPINDGQQFLITDTLDKRIILVDRATKDTVWEYKKPDAKWLQHVFPTTEGTFILEDRQKGEVFEVNRKGEMLWLIDGFSDGKKLSYPTDAAKLFNGHVLISETGRGRVVEVDPKTKEAVREYKVSGFISSFALDQKKLDGSEISYSDQDYLAFQDIKSVQVEEGVKITPTFAGSSNQETVTGRVKEVNASTGKAGQVMIKSGSSFYTVQAYNYTRITKNGRGESLMNIQEKDTIEVTGNIRGGFIAASRIEVK